MILELYIVFFFSYDSKIKNALNVIQFQEMVLLTKWKKKSSALLSIKQFKYFYQLDY